MKNRQFCPGVWIGKRRWRIWWRYLVSNQWPFRVKERSTLTNRLHEGSLAGENRSAVTPGSCVAKLLDIPKTVYNATSQSFFAEFHSACAMTFHYRALGGSEAAWQRQSWSESELYEMRPKEMTQGTRRRFGRAGLFEFARPPRIY